MRRRWIAVLLAGLVLLAGCSADGGPATPSETDSPVGPTTAGGSPSAAPSANETTPARPAATATPAPPVVRPPNEVPRDAENVHRSHVAALAEGGSFTFDSRFLADEVHSDWRLEDHWSVTADLESGRMYLERRSSVSADRFVYVDDSGTAYEPYIDNDTLKFKRPPDALSSPAQFVRPNLVPYIGGIAYEGPNETTVDGETHYVYTADELSQFDDALLDRRYYRNGTVRSARARLVIHESGAIRELSFRINGTDFQGDTIIYSAPLSYDDIGSTDVEAPSWYERAKEQSDDE